MDAVELAEGQWEAWADFVDGSSCYEATAVVVLGGTKSSTKSKSSTKGNKCFESITVEHVATGDTITLPGYDIKSNTGLRAARRHGGVPHLVLAVHPGR